MTKPCFPFRTQNLGWSIAAVVSISFMPLISAQIDSGSPEESQIVERGQDFAVYQRVIAITDEATGKTTSSTNQYTVLENGLHYLENGEWKISEDVIEPFPTGAVARRGPNKAIFSNDLNTKAVFDIQPDNGKRIQGGVRAILLTDTSSGQSVFIGTVKASVPGRILPPNTVIWSDAFDGIKADVVMVWKHDLFQHNVLLREQPEIPKGWNPDAVVIQVVTEFYLDAEPRIQKMSAPANGQADVEDHGIIQLGAIDIIMGKAFAVPDAHAFAVGSPRNIDGIPVRKEWVRTKEDRDFLIESVTYTQAAPHLKDLPVARQAAVIKNRDRALASLDEPGEPDLISYSEPMQLASVYGSAGFLVDFDGVTVPPGGSVTFTAGETYYIPSSFYGASANIAAGCVIKYAANAYLLAYSVFTAPAVGQMMPVFTSKDDDNFGKKVDGSSGSPSVQANPAIWIYYPPSYVTIQNCRIQWATVGVRYDVGSGTILTISDSLFKDCTTGVTASPSLSYVSASNIRKCNVTTSGVTMTTDCGPFYTSANFAGITEFEARGIPPDTQAAVGTNYVMELLNEDFAYQHGQGNQVAFFNKFTGARVSIPTTTINSFFTVTVNNVTYPNPSSGAYDPKVIYDPVDKRYIASALDVITGNGLLAVSRSPDPVGLGGATWVEDNWRKYLIPFNSFSTDFDTLGVDSNGIYVCTRVTSSPTGGLLRVAAMPKAGFLDGSAPTLVPSTQILDLTGAGAPFCYPTLNYDSAATTDYVWFAFESFDKIYYRRLKWTQNGTVPDWQDQYWNYVTDIHGYYRLNGTSPAIRAPQKGTTSYLVDLPFTGSTIGNAILRKVGGVQYLWTCRPVGVGVQNGLPTATNPDRSAVEWIKIRTDTLDINSDVVFDATSSVKFYYMPSISVNRNGDILIGCSGSSANDYISAYYVGAKNGGSWMTTPVRYFAGTDYYRGGQYFRWGDMSATSVDPDGVTFWTVQEYATTYYSSSRDAAYGTRIVAVRP